MAIKIVKQWHKALNSGDVDGMIALVHEDVEIGGPRGKTRGAQIVREWFGRARVTFTPLQFYGKGNVVAVEEFGEWRSETGEVTGNQTVTTVFIVSDGLITSIVRHDDKAVALAEAGLTEADKVAQE